jgi:hypothetical protein
MRSRHEETAGIERAAERDVPRYGHESTVARFGELRSRSANVGTRAPPRRGESRRGPA